LINDWVETVTREKIMDLIKPDMLNANTRLVLVNAIYFKGDWQKKFDPKFTSQEDFHLRDGSTKKVPMMQQTIDKAQFAILDSLGATMVELPYKGDRIVMQVLLPEAGGLPQLEEKLRTAGDLLELWDDAKGTEKVKVTLPKFKLEQTIPLTKHLQALGMSDMFDYRKADFSAIDGTRGLYVSTVIQKAFIEVNEEGSEAAAATGAVMMMRSMPSPPEAFRADRPFLFFLRDKLTGMLLFQGRVEDPSA
jgi:serpin B